MRSRIKQYLQLESTSSTFLFAAAILALVWANSPLSFIHKKIIEVSLFTVNEGLMAFFFLLVGLELKRGYLEGQLSKLNQVILPGAAAIGGMAVPAFLYWIINQNNPIALKAWATPVATDIAFALGVLSLFGNRIRIEIKLFLLVLAIFDDLGAILIIALFYSKNLVPFFVGLSVMITFFLYLLNVFKVSNLWFYMMMGVLLWVILFYSGIHPTIAGVILAFTIPDNNIISPSVDVKKINKKKSRSLLLRLESRLHPWVSYLIMPLFALVNTGLTFNQLSWDSFIEPIVLGIVTGLFLGKQLGVFGFCWVLIRLGWAKLPSNSHWWELYGVSLLCGIGFTMSLFLGTLSYQNQSIYLAEVRLGVILGSLLSGISGALVLTYALFQAQK